MKTKLIFIALIFLINHAFAAQCFIVKEKNTIIHESGNCDERYAPSSTFKIALSLIGYDSKILIDETHPSWPFKNSYVKFLPIWQQEHNPKTWMQNSCVWYSQVLTKKLGMKQFKSYVTKLHYGNMDLHGDKGQNNGLTNAWLSSSLEISSTEQVAFLEKLLATQLPVSQHAHAMTRKILFVKDLPNGWKLYGKTGSGVLLNEEKLEIQHGWYIGWLEKGDRIIIFSNHIADDKLENTFASIRAKEFILNEIPSLIK